MQFFVKKESSKKDFIFDSFLSISFHRNHIWIDKKMKIKYNDSINDSIYL